MHISSPRLFEQLWYIPFGVHLSLLLHTFECSYLWIILLQINICDITVRASASLRVAVLNILELLVLLHVSPLQRLSLRFVLSCCLWKERYFALPQHVDFSFSVIHLLLYNNGYSTSFKNRPPYSVAPHWTQRENISTGLKEQARKCQFSSLPHCITHDLPTYPKRPFCSPAFLGHLLRF